MNSRQFHGVCVTLVCVENVENNLCVYLSLGGLSVAQAGFFTWGIIILLKFDIPRGDYFPSKFRKFSLFMKVLKIGIFGRFLAEWKMHYLAIFLLSSIVTETPYLPKMNLFLWTTFLPKGFKNGIIQRFWRFLNGDYMAWTQHFTFAGFRKKGNSLGTLIVIFDNVSPKGFFWLNMKNFEISVLTANPRYLQTVGHKDMKLDRG